MTIGSGDTIGSYRILRMVGKGGMGAVFEVEHVNLGIRYALKAFVRDHGDIEAMRRRFWAEGRVLARLRHPNLLRVYDLGEDTARGLLYFVMDCLAAPGGRVHSLADFQPGEVDAAQLAKWYSHVRSALEYIHGEGIVHRDVKPANILINANGCAVLADLGISRFLDGELRRDLGVETTSEAYDADAIKIIGSAMFMAPEIKRGEKATPASDAFSLGVTFYRMLTGVWYEPGAVADELIDGFGREWRDAMRRLLADDPAARLPMPDLTPRSPSRWMVPAVLSLVLGGVCLALAAIWLFRHMHKKAAPPEPPEAVEYETVEHETATAPQTPAVYRPPPTDVLRDSGFTFDDFFPLHDSKQPRN